MTPDETPTYEPPVDALAAAAEAAAGMRRHMSTSVFDLELYLGRHRELGYLATVTTSHWTAITYTRDWTT